jgi:hypothetical protein
MEPRCFLSGKQFYWFHRDESIFILVTRNGNVPQKNTKISRLFNADRYAHHNDFNRHQHVGLIRKAKAAQFRLKAAHVLWATAKCRHPGSPEAKCSSPAEVLALQGRRLFRTRELAAEARQ